MSDREAEPEIPKREEEEEQQRHQQDEEHHTEQPQQQEQSREAPRDEDGHENDEVMPDPTRNATQIPRFLS